MSPRKALESAELSAELSAADDIQGRAERALRRGELEIPERLLSGNPDLAGLIENLRVYQAELEIQNTELRSAQAEAQRGMARFVALFSHLPVAELVVDCHGLVQEANDEASRLFALRDIHFRQHFLLRLVDHDGEAELVRVLREAQTAGVAHARSVTFRRADGDRFPGELHVARLPAEQSTKAQLVCAVVDLTERKSAEERLARAAGVFESTQEGILVANPDGVILAVNRAFCEITGYSREQALGKNPRILKSGRHDEAFYQAMWGALIREGCWRGEIWNRRRNGELYPEWLSISATRNPRGEVVEYVAVFSDITLVKRSQEALAYLAHHDPLTGLPNRTLLQDRMDHAIRRAQRQDGRLAVMFVDLDRFKNVNDTLGHPVGDALLQAVANRLTEQMRAGDTLARLGGDEFVILLEDATGALAAGVVARKLLDLLTAPLQVGGHDLHITASIGIARYPADGQSAEELLRQADAAMYRAKEQGRNGFHFYEPSMTAETLARLRLEYALRGAADRGELTLHYQPQVDLTDGRLLGAEALLRWEHPELGMVPPARFIPVAEEAGMLEEIGGWVLREACRQLAAWDRAGLHLPRLAVNLSIQQIERGTLLPMLTELLDRTGLAPERLELELTESMLMRQTGRARDTLRGLVALRVQLAVDDFGTGYSSLERLRCLPVVRLKIDRSFVREIGRDPGGESIVRAIIALGHSLDLDIVAEGVEQDEQAAFLLTHGCRAGQGYLFARPLPADALEAFCAAPGACSSGG